MMMSCLKMLFWFMASAMRENAHAGLLTGIVDGLNFTIKEEAAKDHDLLQLAWNGDDPFKDDPWFKEKRDPNYQPFKDDPWFKEKNDPNYQPFKDKPFFDKHRPKAPKTPETPAKRNEVIEPNEGHDYHRSTAAAGGVFVIFHLMVLCMCGSIFCCPCLCMCRGHFKARELRTKLEGLQLKHPPHAAPRQPAATVGDGMMRLAQENQIMIKEKVNMAQELSGHVLGYSIQTANSFDVLSVAGGGDHVLSCREVQDLQAMMGMNLAAGLQAMGVDAAGHFAGRDKAPFRMMIGLSPALGPTAGGKMQVVVPEGVVTGQQIQVTAPTGEQFLVAVPPGVAPGQAMEVQMPSKQQNTGAGMQQMMEGLVPGCAANNDAPFLYLNRPFAVDCFCFNRPTVDVFDVRGSLTVKLGIISDPFAWMDMTFGIHIGPNATQSDPPILIARGAACQPGTMCQCCGLCCGRSCQEAYLEVIDPNADDRTVAFITKGWAGGMQELFTSANTFYVDFGEVKDPSCKALLLATALFVNYRFFEGQAGQRNSGFQS